MNAPVLAYIAVGANLGDREANIHEALRRLDASDGVRILAVSSLLDNPPVGLPAGAPPFLNAAAKLETTLGPHALLHRLQDIERKLGRVRREDHVESRPIDLDILLYGDQVLNGRDLTIPHPRMHERSFVLRPLAEIAAEVVHPVLGRTIGELVNNT